MTGTQAVPHPTEVTAPTGGEPNELAGDKLAVPSEPVMPVRTSEAATATIQSLG